MKIIRLISQIIFLLTRFLALVYFVSALYSAIVLLLYNVSPQSSSIPIHSYVQEIAGQPTARFKIFFPFTEKPLFLMKDTVWGYVELVFGIALYGLFFYLLSNVFNAFRQKRLFTAKAIRVLRNFAIANFIFPPLFFIFLFLSPSYELSEGELLITSLHLLLGLFAWFQATIFKEGFTLQNEIDLTI